MVSRTEHYCPNMKNKKKPVALISARFTDAQEELRRTYQSWEQRWPHSLQWHKRAARATREWWDLAAEVCLQHSVPPPLLFYIVYAHANGRSEDSEIPFSPTSFRSEQVMLRALANWRSVLGSAAKHLEPLYQLDHRKRIELPRSSLEAGRLIAELSCRYFETVLEVLGYGVTKGKWQLSDLQHDLLAYQLAFFERNPFILLRVARTERLRVLAAGNAFCLCDQQPWHRAVWEGVAVPEALDRLSELARHPRPRDFYENQQVRIAWPLELLRGDTYHGWIENEGAPQLVLSNIRFCDKTDLFLAAKFHNSRNGHG